MSHDEAGTGGDESDAVEEATGLRVAIIRIQRQLRARSGIGHDPVAVVGAARIEQDGPLRLGAPADLEGTTAATMSRVIDSLAALGLIERVPDPLDGRASLVQLSAEGASWYARCGPATPRRCVRALAELPPADREVVRRAIPVMARLSELLQSSERVDIG